MCDLETSKMSPGPRWTAAPQKTKQKTNPSDWTKGEIWVRFHLNNVSMGLVANPAAFILYLLEGVAYQSGEAAAAFNYTSICQCRRGKGKAVP